MLNKIKRWLVYMSSPAFGVAAFGVAAFLVVAGAAVIFADVTENT